MYKQLTFLVSLIFFSSLSYATHNRAGEIIYRILNNNELNYEVTIITYTKESSIQADRPELEINWGDGVLDTLPRTLQVSLGNDIKKNEYKGRHLYAGAAPFYVISVADPNRIANIINVNNSNSVNILFYIEDTLRILQTNFLGINNSPVLINPPIDFANLNDTFYHNPNAYDPDGDSLTFELVDPLQIGGSSVPNYQYPDELNTNPPQTNTFTINLITGEVLWTVPRVAGIYNIAILVREFRDDIQMGTLLRDMQIIVLDKNNDPPQIKELKDTCVIAGSLLGINVLATDNDQPQQTVRLTADGGPFQVNTNPASFTATNGLGSATGTFEWQTDCNHIRKQFYEVVFKAEDNFSQSGIPFPLVDLETWLVEVVAPAPEDPKAVAQGSDIRLEWKDPYTCEASNKFIGFSVWRREGSNPFVPENCETGLAGRGYTKIASDLQDHFHVDQNVSRGKKYCYRILAEFASIIINNPGQQPIYKNKVESLPSTEVCAELRRDVPLITHVTVANTDQVNGEIIVSWNKPLADSVNLDTILFPGPYIYELYRSDGFVGSNFGVLPINTFTGATYSQLNDTTFTDKIINTVDNPWSYKIIFYGNNGLQEIGETEIASSIFLDIAATDNVLELSWQEQVPWTNYSYTVYRESSPGIFQFIAETVQQSYNDSGLVNGTEYCYYIESKGMYSAPDINDTLINYSQEKCGIPLDTIAPCPPFLTVENSCPQFDDNGDEELFNCDDLAEPFINNLHWSNQNEVCSDDVLGYNIYYKSPFEDDFSLIASNSAVSDTTFTHLVDNSLAGYYVVTALDSFGNESIISTENSDTIDNCPCYNLPNVFTPNGDGKNDFYTPFLPYRFIESIDMKIFNRWGDLVFETTDPDINWDGKDFKTSNELKDGVFFYSCEVYEIRITGVKRKPIILKGYIHLIHGNGDTN